MSSQKSKRGNKISKKLIGGLTTGLFVVTLFAGLFFAFYVTPLQRQVTVEAGETLQTDPAVYFRASDIALSLFCLESSPDHTLTVGNTNIVYSYLHFFKLKVEVSIVDTTAPDFELIQNEVGIEPKEELAALSLVMGLKDNAEGGLTVTFADHSEKKCFESYGIFEEMICVTDESGNFSEMPVTIWVAEAPEITAPDVYYVMQSQEGYEPEEFLSSVDVTDVQDEESAKDTLSVVIPNFDSNREGVYEAVISATNSYHVTQKVNVPVHVVPEEEMTDALIEDTDALFLGEVLTKDTGAELIKEREADAEKAAELIQPTLVSIYYTLSDKGYAYGNGFVIDLTEDAAYIASNHHVLAAFGDKRAELTFYPGYHTDDYTFLGGSEEDDVAFIKIDRSALPEEVFDYLKEPKISMARALTIEIGEELFRTSCFINKPNQTEGGSFLQYDQQIFNGSVYTTFTVPMEQGDSGSAIYDAHGYLISMCAGISHQSDVDLMCGVRLESIVSEYERVSGNKLYAF